MLGKSGSNPVMVPFSIIKTLFAAVEQLGFKADAATLQEVKDTINELNYRLTNLPKIYEWLVGSGVPANTLGNDGQFFLNTDGDLYQKVSGSWQFQLTLGNTRFLGSYISLAALTSAHPSPKIGSYAYIDPGVGASATIASWDETDSVWVQGSTTSAETASSIKTKYESNANTNAFTDALKATLEGIHTVATSGSYTDLTNKPSFAAIATTGDALDLMNVIAAIDAAVGNSYWRNDHLNKIDATVAPDADNDTTEGYTVGSIWIDIVGKETYRCVDASEGAANWQKTTLSTTELANVALSGSYTDLTDKPASLSQAVVEAGTDTTFGLISAERLAQAIAALGASGTAGEYGEVAITSVTSLDNSHAGKLIRADMSGGAYDLDIPSGLTKNRWVAIELTDASNALTLDAGGGVTIVGPTTISTANKVVTLVHTNTQDTYRVYTGVEYVEPGTTRQITVGYSTAVSDQGTKSTGTWAPDEADGAYQKIVNGGAFTLNPPTNQTAVSLLITNNASAGTITTSGFTQVVGSFDTTDGNKFLCQIQKIDTVSILTIQPLQ